MNREHRLTLDAIIASTVDGVSPSLQEIAVATGLSPKSKDIVRRRLLELRRLGLVEFEPYKARTVRVIADDRAYTPAALNELPSESIRRLIATASGVLAHRDGGGLVDATLRRIGDRLMGRPRVSA